MSGLNPAGVEAANRVLLEVWTILGEYRDALTVVGGAAPPLLIGDVLDDPYVGTLDVDAVLDPAAVLEPIYRRMSEVLLERGYRQDPQNHFRWFRFVVLDDQEIEVELDFLAPPDGTRHRHVRLEGERVARSAEGAAIVREQFEIHTLSGILPDGRPNTVELRVAGPAALVVLKALALDGRDKPKDAYDIDYLLAHTGAGIDSIGDSLRSWDQIEIVSRAVAVLSAKFRDVNDYGPSSVAFYRGVPEGQRSDQVRALAYARVRRLLSIVRGDI